MSSGRRILRRLCACISVDRQPSKPKSIVLCPSTHSEWKGAEQKWLFARLGTGPWPRALHRGREGGRKRVERNEKRVARNGRDRRAYLWALGRVARSFSSRSDRDAACAARKLCHVILAPEHFPQMSGPCRAFDEKNSTERPIRSRSRRSRRKPRNWHATIGPNSLMINLPRATLRCSESCIRFVGERSFFRARTSNCYVQLPHLLFLLRLRLLRLLRVAPSANVGDGQQLSNPQDFAIRHTIKEKIEECQNPTEI